jgi:hypothetical protein
MRHPTCSISGVEIPEEEVGGCEGGQYCDYCAYSTADTGAEFIGWVLATLIVSAIALLVIFWPGATAHV